MDEDKELGQSLEDKVQAPDATQTDAAELPDRWKGKSPVDIAKSYEELERKLGDQGRQFGEVKKSLDSLQSELAYYRQGGQQTQKPQAEPDEEFEAELYKNPAKTLDKFFGKKMQEFQIRQRYEQSARERERAFSEVKRMEPDVFSDPEIEQGVRQFVDLGVRQGSLDPMIQADPNSLGAIGVYLKHLKDKKSPQRNPTMPIETESPSAVKRQTPTKKNVELNDWDKGFLRNIIENYPEVGIKSYQDAAELIEEKE